MFSHKFELSYTYIHTYIHTYIYNLDERTEGCWCEMVLLIQKQRKKNKERRTRDIHSSVAKKIREKNLGGARVY